MKFRTLGAIAALSFAVSGCVPTENYQLRYAFLEKMTASEEVTVVNRVAHLEYPFASISCRTNEFMAELEHRDDIFTIMINGPETEERCSRVFGADLMGVQPGTYQLELIYLAPNGAQKVLAKPFTIAP